MKFSIIYVSFIGLLPTSCKSPPNLHGHANSEQQELLVDAGTRDKSSRGCLTEDEAIMFSRNIREFDTFELTKIAHGTYRGMDTTTFYFFRAKTHFPGDNFLKVEKIEKKYYFMGAEIK